MRAWIGLLLMAAPLTAHAQALVLRDGDRLLTASDRDVWLNRARCLCAAPLAVTLDLSGATATSLSRVALVVGKSCLTSESRISSACRTLWDDKVGSDGSRTVDVAANTLAGSCTLDDTRLTLSILIDVADDDQWTSFASLELGADTVAPSAPKTSSLVAGEGLVEVSFGASSTTDVSLHYQVLCSTDAGDVVLDDPPEALFVSPWDLCAAPEADPELAAAFVCAEASGGTESVTVTRLQDGSKYRFAVVSIDDQGNASARTELGTATPAAEEDFWERYQRSGGAADGSGCQAVGKGGLLGVFAALMFGLVRRINA